jgi:hypothetical protein
MSDTVIRKISAFWKVSNEASRPYRSRTCDTLIKSQVDIFPLFRAFTKLESAGKILNF